MVGTAAPVQIDHETLELISIDFIVHRPAETIATVGKDGPQHVFSDDDFMPFQRHIHDFRQRVSQYLEKRKQSGFVENGFGDFVARHVGQRVVVENGFSHLGRFSCIKKVNFVRMQTGRSLGAVFNAGHSAKDSVLKVEQKELGLESQDGQFVAFMLTREHRRQMKADGRANGLS